MILSKTTRSLGLANKPKREFITAILIAIEINSNSSFIKLLPN
jgi:hypothetical protein